MPALANFIRLRSNYFVPVVPVPVAPLPVVSLSPPRRVSRRSWRPSRRVSRRSRRPSRRLAEEQTALHQLADHISQ